MFNLNDYEDVDARIHKFYEKYPDGAIVTELVQNDEEKGVVIFKAIAYRTHVDNQPSAVGYARGSRKDRGVDRDFWLENCETSSIGRCIANLGLAAKGKRPSSLEMAKANDAKEHAVPTVRVRTKEHKEFIEANNASAQVIWDTTIEPPADMQPAFENAVDLVAKSMAAEPIPRCSHGDRVLREGHGKNGAYRGWMCSLPMKMKSQQCKPIWMILDPTGKWVYRPEDEGLVTA